MIVTDAGETITDSDVRVRAPEVYSTVTVPASDVEPRPEKVATPDTGVAVAVSRVFPPVSLTVAVTSVDHVVSILPPESTTVTTGCGEKSVP